MTINILCFGIAKDITGQRFLQVEVHEGATVGSLRKMLTQQHPRLAALATVRLAVNSEYAEEALLLKAEDEVAIIPPVSGG